MVAGGDYVDSKWGEKKMEVEDSVRTVDCLRGRLLAERAASRNAKDEAQILGDKLTELENLLKQEAKSRNRAEKKLKFLLKKLESLNISYVSDESQQLDKSDISSVSSSTSITRGLQENNEDQQIKISETFEIQKNLKPQRESQNLHQNTSQNSLLSLGDDSSTNEGSSTSAFETNLAGQASDMNPNEDPKSPEVSENSNQQNSTVEDSLSSVGDAHSEKSSQQGSNQYYNDSKTDEQSVRSSSEYDLNQEDDQDPNGEIDNSMALVPVDKPQKNLMIDPEVLDATVKKVLDDLRHAKERLQSSMDRKRTNMIRVG